MANSSAERTTRNKIIAIGPTDVSLVVIREEVMRKVAIVIVCALVLSGCGGTGSGVGMKESPLWHMSASAEEKLNYFTQQCLKFGFKNNTPEMAQCIQNQSNQSRGNASATLGRLAQQEQQRLNGIRTTNCRQWGRQVNCTTY